MNIKLDIDTVGTTATYVLTPEEYRLKIKSFFGTLCFLSLTPIQYQRTTNFVVLGTTFMKKFYTHFDKTNNKIGFAQATHSDSP
jgi:cathepsin D